MASECSECRRAPGDLLCDAHVIAGLRAALETAERRLEAETAKACEGGEIAERARIVAHGKRIARSMMPNDGAAVLGFVRWIERADDV